MTGTTLTALKAAQTALLLKPLDAAVFLAPWYTAAPASYTDSTATLQPLPAAFQSVGFIDKKSGIAFARNITAAPIDSYGELEPTRDDVTDDVTTIEFEPQQTNLTTLQLTTNTNLSAVLADSASGEINFAQPIAPQITYYSAIIIGKDGNDSAPIYIIKYCPKVAVTKYAGEQWTPTTLVSQKLTLTAFKDDTAGAAVFHGFGGLGWKNILTKTGFQWTVTSLTIAPATLTLTAALGAPTLATPTTATTGGTLPATQAYYYKLTATNAFGETIASAEKTVTTGAGSTNANTVTWTQVTGAAGYKLYRSTTAGAEVLLATITGGATVSYSDTGAATPGTATPPATDTTAHLTQVLNATDNNGRTLAPAYITWSSSAPAVATVDSSGTASAGTVTRVGAGTATITATYQGYTSTATVTVAA